MSTVRAQFSVGPQRVWEVLADPGTYADWVVGSHSIRDADPGWPEAGSRFYHRVGTGPLTVNDHTEVLEADPPRKLVLHARARPIGTARVQLDVAPADDGSDVSITETAGDLLSYLAINPLTYRLMDKRNTETLRRLKRIAETGIVKP